MKSFQEFVSEEVNEEADDQSAAIAKVKSIRDIMKSHGVKSVFTNKYPNHRTVKCYTHGGQKEKDLIKHLRDEGHNANIDGGGNQYGLNSLIVHVPHKE